MKPVCLCEKFRQWCREYRSIFIWLCVLLVVVSVGVWLSNTLTLNLLKDYKIIESNSLLGNPVEKEISAVAEYQSFLSILSLFISLIVAWIAWQQFPKVATQSEKQAQLAEAEFITHIDQEWCSEKITQVRAELWGIYRDAKNRPMTHEDCLREVQRHVISVDQRAKNEPTEVYMEHLFRLLNFLELLGTIYILHKKKLIDDDLLVNIFGGRLKTYLEFYEGYFDRHKAYTTNAKKLLDHMRTLDTKGQE